MSPLTLCSPRLRGCGLGLLGFSRVSGFAPVFVLFDLVGFLGSFRQILVFVFEGGVRFVSTRLRWLGWTLAGPRRLGDRGRCLRGLIRLGKS